MSYQLLRERARAGSYLRVQRDAAHAAFDPLWQHGFMKRHQAYKWLARELGIPRAHRHTYCHVGMFDILTCQRVIAVSQAKYAELQQAELMSLAITDKEKWSDLL